MKTRQKIEEIISRMNAEPLHRMGAIQRVVRAAEGDKPETVSYELSFSSEEPYERWFGVEVLGHKAEEVEMDWLKGGRAPLLLQHDPDKQIGVIDSAKISEARGRATVRFGAGALAKEIQADVDSGVRGNVSVGYEVLDMVLAKTSDKGPDEYRVTKWRPVEVSIVSIPADTTVGVGRNKTNVRITKEPNMSDENQDKTKDAVAAERARISEIGRMGKTHKLDTDAEKAIRDGMPVNEFQSLVLKRLEAGHKPLGSDAGDLSRQEQKDVQRFSVVKAIRGKLEGTLDGIEREMHIEGVREAKASGVATGGLVIPYLVLSRSAWSKRSLTATGVDTGDQIVAEILESGSFIDVLRNSTVLRVLGARFLDGLSGNIAIPKKLTPTVPGVKTEVAAADASTPTIGQVEMTPRRVTVKTEYSKQLMLQSSLSVEAMLREDIAQGLGLKIEELALLGTGSNGQPTGVLNFVGRKDVNNGANGGNPAYGKFVDMETECAVANAAVGSLGYLVNAKTRGYCKQTEIAEGTARMIWEPGNSINGYATQVTNALPSNRTKGEGTGLSAAFFANWADLLLGFWGGLDLLVDPYTLGDQAMVRIIANNFFDVAGRHDESFCGMVDIDTVIGG